MSAKCSLSQVSEGWQRTRGATLKDNLSSWGSPHTSNLDTQYYRGGQTFLLAGQIRKRNSNEGSQKTHKKNCAFFNFKPKNRTNYSVFLQNHVQKQGSTSLKFVTGAEKKLWRSACGPRAAVWPCLQYYDKNEIKISLLCTFGFWVKT